MKQIFTILPFSKKLFRMLPFLLKQSAYPRYV